MDKRKLTLRVASAGSMPNKTLVNSEATEVKTITLPSRGTLATGRKCSGSNNKAHACDPNCETDQIRNRIWIIALRNIEAGEELTYDYNLFDADPGELAP